MLISGNIKIDKESIIYLLIIRFNEILNSKHISLTLPIIYRNNSKNYITQLLILRNIISLRNMATIKAILSISSSIESVFLLAGLFKLCIFIKKSNNDNINTENKETITEIVKLIIGMNYFSSVYCFQYLQYIYHYR